MLTEIWKFGKRFYIVVCSESGEWLYWHELRKAERLCLIGHGMQVNEDSEASLPDPNNSADLPD